MLFIGLLASALFLTPTTWADPDRLLVLHSYPPGEWYHGIHEGLRQGLNARHHPVTLHPIVFHSEYWLRKSASEVAGERTRILGWMKEQRPAAVVVCDDEAADTFSTALHGAGYPVFYLGINREISEIPWWPQIRSSAAVVQEKYPVEQLLTVVSKVFPKRKNMALISSRNQSSRIILRQIRQDIQQGIWGHSFRVSEEFVSDSWSDWKHYLREAHNRVDLLWVLVPYDVRDSHGVEVPIERMGNWFEQRVRVPTLGLSSVHTKMGVLMTIAITPQQLGRAVADQIHLWKRGEKMPALAPRIERQGQLQIHLPVAKRLRVSIPREVLSVSHVVEETSLPYGR